MQVVRNTHTWSMETMPIITTYKIILTMTDGDVRTVPYRHLCPGLKCKAILISPYLPIGK